MSEWRKDRVGACLDGTNPTVLAELDAAFAVIGDTQFLPGYSLALTKGPGVDRLSDLPRAERIRLHPASRWHDPATMLGPQHDELRSALAAELIRLRAVE